MDIRYLTVLNLNLRAKWGGGIQHHALAALPQKMSPLLILQKAGLTPGLVRKGVDEKIPLRPPGFKPRTIRPVVSDYADCAITPKTNRHTSLIRKLNTC
jgi:hypothetical protein